MKIQIFVIIFSVVSLISNVEKIDESFSIRGLPDNAWVLEFEKNGTYEYYHWNGWGGTKTLDKGKYEMKSGVLKLRSTKRDQAYKNEIPRKLFYSEMKKKEFENLNGNFFAYNEKKVAFRNQYIVISKKKLQIE